MNKKYIFLVGLLFIVFQAFPQMFILNEDFSGTSGTTPPSGWTNVVISGGTADQWHFDNPGDRVLNYPITEPFAIFDADSTSANGQPEIIALETSLFDASTSNYILLNFVHVLDPGLRGEVTIEAYDGNTWHEVAAYSSATANPETEIVDLSAVAGGITNARIRFIWSGDGEGFWAIDNIRIYASLPLDGGLVSIDNPVSPVVPGTQEVKVTLGNFGYNTLTSTTFHWTADGVAQAPFTWGGSIGFGQTLSNISIGTYNFQDPVMITVWQSNPNGQTDLNQYNDTISQYLVAALCGTYTIGGANPDFEDFSQVAEVLNTAGVTCPVTFLLRDGTYYEQFKLFEIPGTSATNTVTFRSESGDSTKAIIRIIPGALKFESMIYLNGTQHLFFENVGFMTGSNVSYSNNAILFNNASDISVERCYFEIRNQVDYGANISAGSRNIEIINNHFESISGRAGAVNVTGNLTREILINNNFINGPVDWGYAAIRIAEGASQVEFTSNHLNRSFRGMTLDGVNNILVSGNHFDDINEGIRLDNLCTSVELSANRLTGVKSNQNVPEGTSGIFIKNSSAIDIFNNFIHTTGDGPVMCITLDKATACSVVFNSTNTTNTDALGISKGFLLTGDNQVIARNNIFRIKNGGIPVFINDPTPQLDFDRNNYISPDNTIGYFNGTRFDDLENWHTATGLDINSLSVIPFYTSETDLSINQALLNNYGVPVTGITEDIDGVLRDPSTPDLGAKEYDLCTTDAGVNEIAGPVNPLNGGVQDVTVILQNQGSATLTSSTINWSVNDEAQASYPWTGNLLPGNNVEVVIGDYNFQSGLLYKIKAWTSNPNNSNDCNHLNDTISSPELAVPLCGDYTIGGVSPDFATISEAVNLLNLAGVTCPVVFNVRNGTYYEQFVIDKIQGSSASNTVTFQSQHSDSTQAVIRIIPNAMKYASMIYLENTENMIFRKLGLFTGGNLSYNNNAIIMSGSKNIHFENCYFEVRKEDDIGIAIQAGCSNITILNNRFESFNPRAVALDVSGGQTRDINITGNYLKGPTELNAATIRFREEVRAVVVEENHIEGSFRAIEMVNTDTVSIQRNIISNCNEGMIIGSGCSRIIIAGNRLFDIKSHSNVQEGTNGISLSNMTQADVFNNFIHTSGSGPVTGINLQSSSQCRISFNSVNITNTDSQDKSRGINIKTSIGIISKNNIFSIKNSGSPVSISGTLQQFDVDRNNYFRNDHYIGLYNGRFYDDMQTWQDSTKFDQNSLSVNPFFTTDTDLSISQVLLNNAGVAVPGIINDIDGSARNPVNPDLGAREYNPCGNDAGINEITSPVNPLSGGTEEVRALLQNQGTADLSSVQINWMVNDDLRPPYAWSGSLGASGNAEVLLGNYDFQTGSFTIKAWTSLPNNTADCNVNNDTVYSRELSGPLCGTYTVGGEDADFTSFSQVAEVLNTAGITCPITFLVRDGIYLETIIISEIKGVSVENTITFRSESGDNTKAVLKIDPEAVNYEPMVFLSNTSHITFRDIGLFTGSSGGIANTAVKIGGCDHIEFTNCLFEIKNENDFGIDISGASFAITISQSRFECINSKAGAINIGSDLNHDIMIADNTINGSGAWGNTLMKAGGSAKNITIEGNNFDRSYRAIYFIDTDTVSIIGNTINNTNQGIYIDNQCTQVDISANRLTNVQSYANLPDGTSGIFIQNSTGVDVINNYVQSGGGGPVLAINLQNITNCRALYNSINITNTDPQGKSKGIYIRSGSEILGRNNLCNIKSSGIPIHLEQAITSLNLDYNNYYHPNGMIGKVDDVVYTNLVAWGQSTKGDANSLNVNPYFKADTIPLPYQKSLNGAGISVSGVLFDIDGKLRHIQAPDIGCLEFFIDFGILELLSPTLDCYHPDVDSVKVYIRQFGDVPFDNLKIAYKIDEVGITHMETVSGPLIFDFIHTFLTTETLSAPGDYTFRIWLEGNTDDNINNDVLVAKRYSKPPPTVSIDYDNECTGWEVNFTGNATIENPYYVAGYEWLFGDGDTSYLQNPVHIFTDPGTYEVIFRAYSSAGCYSETSTTLNIDNDFQGINLDYNLQNETCIGDGTGSLEIIGTGGTPPYKYYVNDNLVDNPYLSNLQPGIYRLRVEDAKQCTKSDTVESFVLVNLDPDIDAFPGEGLAPLTVEFDYTANGDSSRVWHFPGGLTDTSRTPSYTFTEFGYYTIILEVNSGPPYYCIDTASIEIFADIIVTIDANTVFTPNNDGYNDFFEIHSSGVETMEAHIFSQWGTEVYEINEIDGKWDGTTKSGSEAPDGTYFWAIKAKGINQKDYEKKGSVLLLRHGAEAFPNPVSDNVRIKVHGTLNAPASATVFSVFGQASYSEIIDDPGNIILDLSHLPGGIYIIKIDDGSTSSFVRIIKN
jgi:gliding motility-associated-like protein